LTHICIVFKPLYWINQCTSNNQKQSNIITIVPLVIGDAFLLFLHGYIWLLNSSSMQYTCAGQHWWGSIVECFKVPYEKISYDFIWSHLILSDLMWESSDHLISHLIFLFLRWENYFLIWAYVFLILPQMLIWFLIWFLFLILISLNLILLYYLRWSDKFLMLPACSYGLSHTFWAC